MTTPLPDDAVAALFEAHAPALVLYARQWVGPAEAEDVLQRVFVRLLAGGRLPAEPRPWLFRCARNEVIGAWRSARRRARRERSAAGVAPHWFVPDPGGSLDARTAQTALEQLPEAQWEVVTLRLWSGLTLAETAAVTGLTVSTVQRRYVAALEALRNRLEAPCGNPIPPARSGR